MIVYHGLPFGLAKPSAQRVLTNRHILLSYATCKGSQEQYIDLSASTILDNGAFTYWRRKEAYDFEGFVVWARRLIKHPSVEWFLAPDIIDGSEEQNDELLSEVPPDLSRPEICTPVWHLHESVERLLFLCSVAHRVALGSSGQYQRPGSRKWYARMHVIWPLIPHTTKVHGLRMCAGPIVGMFPFSSVDSTTAGRHGRFKGTIPPGPFRNCTPETRVRAIAEEMEMCPKAVAYRGMFKKRGG